MTVSRLNLRVLAMTFAATMLGSTTIALVRPKPIESAILGAEWQCSQTAFIVTTCTPRAPQAVPVVQTSGKIAFRQPKG